MQQILTIDNDTYCISENKSMDVNIITKLCPNEDGLMVLHKFVDWVQGTDISEQEMIDYIKWSIQNR